MKKCRILITGANGFVGSNLLLRLLREPDYNFKAATRTLEKLPQGTDGVKVRELTSCTDWSEALTGIDCVIHTAGRAHIMKDKAIDHLAEFRRVNVAATANLARQAVAAGVKRFVFLSTIKVNGEETIFPQRFSENSATISEDAYGFSKLEAERVLFDIAEETGLDVVVVRLPLVYGPGVKGNFHALLKLIRKRIPLPLGAVVNKRSMVFVDNLIDFILCCVTESKAAGQIFVVSDDMDVSTAELVRELSAEMGQPARLFPVPVALMEAAGNMLGKKEVVKRLFSSLQVDISKAKTELNWHPPFTLQQGLSKTVEWLNAQDNRSNKVAGKFPFFKGLTIRICDFLFALTGLAFGFPLLALVAVAGYFDTGSPIFSQERVGQGKKPFILVKFRTMTVDTASVASHLASSSSITKLGHFLRRSKLDELPQLWNVLKGEMSLVGPRPCLFNQEELIHEREQRGVYAVRPGITGLAQISGIDMSTPQLLAEIDARMIAELSLKNYFKYIAQTVIGKGSGDRVKSD